MSHQYPQSRNNTWSGTNAFSLATASTLAGFDASKNLVTLSTSTYPSLTELTYLKGVTSSIQTQLGTKVPTSRTITINGISYDLSADRSWTVSGGVTGATNTTLTLTSTTLGLNLANANTWTALQTKRITTKQDQWEYDASNYANLTVDSTGISVFDAVGTAPEFQFRDKLGIGATHTNNSLFNVYGVGATYAFVRTMSNVNVAHGMTSDFPTDVYAVDQMCETTKGGYFLTGIVDTGNENAMKLRGVLGTTTPTSAAIRIIGGKKNGTTTQNLADTEKMVTFTKNNGDEVIIVYGNGDTKFNSGKVIHNLPEVLKAYTVATLPTGAVGYFAYVTDALAPTYLTTVVGGGAIKCPVFFDGTNWVAH